MIHKQEQMHGRLIITFYLKKKLGIAVNCSTFMVKMCMLLCRLKGEEKRQIQLKGPAEEVRCVFDDI